MSKNQHYPSDGISIQLLYFSESANTTTICENRKLPLDVKASVLSAKYVKYEK